MAELTKVSTHRSARPYDRSVVDVPEPGGHITDVATLLDLEQLDRDIFRGQNARHGDPDGPLYGGQEIGRAHV